MKIYKYTLISALSLATIPAHADDPIQREIKAEIVKFESCYAKTPASEILDKCDYAKACLSQEPGNRTSLGMSFCTSRDHELWDAKLNIEYKRTLQFVERIYGKSSLEALRMSQRIWIKYRDAECHAQVERFDLTGSYAAAKLHGCKSALTAKRAIQFKTENMSYVSRWGEIEEQ